MRKQMSEEARIGVCSIEAILRKVEGEEGWGENTRAGSGKEGVLYRGGIGTWSRKRREMGRKLVRHFVNAGDGGWMRERNAEAEDEYRISRSMTP